MTPRPLLALPLAFALWPAAGALAQEGPSFDCRYAGTRTEIAICNSPELSALERSMVASYERLADSIGQRQARSIADELLVRRQACEGDPGCIAERLLISMEVFEQRARPRDRVADLAPSVPLPDGEIGELVPVVPEPAPAPEPVSEPEIASAEPIEVAPAPESDIPLAAQAPWPVEAVPSPPSRETETELASAEPFPDETSPDVDEPVAREDLPLADLPPPVEGLDEAIEGAELASSEGAEEVEASFDSPLSWAFMDLEREGRAAIQERLATAGFFEGEATGTWTAATQASLERFAVEEGSDSFDLSTQSGAGLLLDYIGSEAFATAWDIGAAGEADPLTGADW